MSVFDKTWPADVSLLRLTGGKGKPDADTDADKIPGQEGHKIISPVRE